MLRSVTSVSHGGLSVKLSITPRDGGVCILCGMDPIDVVHIVARRSGDQGRVNWIRQVAPMLTDFRKDDPSNLILCPTHHCQYDSGRFVLVPSKQQREFLIDHELRNFVMREEILADGGSDPGRTLPQLIDEFEYIPIQAGPFRMHIYNPTPYDAYLFTFDNMEHRPSPLLHFRASHIALMVEAEPYLSSVTRVQTSKGDMAEPQISTLLRLYQRQPGHYSTPPTISIPNNYEAICAELEQPNNHRSAHILSTVLNSPPPMNAPTPSTSFAKVGPIPELTPTSSTSTDVSSQPDDVNAFIQLMEYMKEPSVTWEDLKNRPPLFGGEEVGPWRFASTDDVCRSKRF